ncbi:hypothetical protein SDC9_132955 [bioreactor metagenome]|uniref:Outer membrane protein beta-barrel domain-containing protein n=1 Tax=bioreactor metagenome TaxID=1076179 RepID=A0A645DBC6_9ZZZZ
MIRKLLLKSLVICLLSTASVAQNVDGAETRKRPSIKNTPDSLTPGARHYLGWNFGRVFSSFHAFNFEFTTSRSTGVNLEIAYKPAIRIPSLPGRYAWFPPSTSRQASSIISGKLSFQSYLRAGQHSFLYVGPYFRFDYLEAENVLIWDSYDGSYPAYIFTRFTRLYKAGISVGSRNISKGFSFFWGMSAGFGFYSDNHNIVQLEHIDSEDPTLDYPYSYNYPVPDFTVNVGFAFGFRKRAMFER